MTVAYVNEGNKYISTVRNLILCKYLIKKILLIVFDDLIGFILILGCCYCVAMSLRWYSSLFLGHCLVVVRWLLRFCWAVARVFQVVVKIW